MTITRLHLTIFIGVIVLAWGSILAVSGTTPSREYLAPFSMVVTIAVLFMLCVEKVFWPLKIFHGWLFVRPDLRGTWKMVLKSDWINPGTGTVGEPIVCYITFTQTLFELQVLTLTPGAHSTWRSHSIRSAPSGGGYEVAGIFDNVADPFTRADGNLMHMGAVLLQSHGPKHHPSGLSGTYWNTSKAMGTLMLSDRRDEAFGTYAEAEAAFSTAKSPAGA